MVYDIGLMSIFLAFVMEAQVQSAVFGLNLTGYCVVVVRVSDLRSAGVYRGGLRLLR